MSKSYISPEKGGSSVRELDVSRTYEQEKERRVNNSQSAHTESSPIGSEMSEEQRIKKASELMESTEARDLNLEVGELIKISPDLIIERTQSGFTAYVVSEE